MLLRVAVDAAPWLVDDPFVPEVGSQGVVICGKGASAGDNGQSENMMIIGRARRGGAKALFLVADSFGVDESQASCSLQRHKLPADVLIPREFFSELTCGDEAGRAALPKKPVDDSAGLHEELGRDVCVNNEAHVRYPEDRALL